MNSASAYCAPLLLSQRPAPPTIHLMDNDVELEYKLRLALAEVASAHASVETGLNEVPLDATRFALVAAHSKSMHRSCNCWTRAQSAWTKMFAANKSSCCTRWMSSRGGGRIERSWASSRKSCEPVRTGALPLCSEPTSHSLALRTGLNPQFIGSASQACWIIRWMRTLAGKGEEVCCCTGVSRNASAARSACSNCTKTGSRGRRPVCAPPRRRPCTSLTSKARSARCPHFQRCQRGTSAIGFSVGQLHHAGAAQGCHALLGTE